MDRFVIKIVSSIPVLFAIFALNLLQAASPCPQIDPSKTFFGNFNNACYAVTLNSNTGTNESGDPNATYDQVYYTITPGYELVVYGIYPNARFLSATIYDEHLAVTSTMDDSKIVPLNSTMINPMLPGAYFTPSQYYGLVVTFGGGPVQSVSPGCSTSGTNIGQNVLEASQIHSGLSWSGYPNLPVGFPVHQTGANSAGILMIRKYLDIDSPKISETVIVRSLATGCAIPAQQAIDLNILSTTQNLSSTWLNQAQISAHQEFAQTIQPSYCFPLDPENDLEWLRATDYIPLDDNYAGYMNAAFTSRQTQSLLTGQTYLRVQFQAPTTPDTPCTTGTCSLTGNEQTRYMSFSFQGPQQNVAGPATLFSVSDQQFVKDPNGNVTLIVGFGAPQPSFVTPANYYTWVDLSQVVNIDTIIGVRIRDLLTNPTFGCSTNNVPYQTTEFNNVGGYMGNYVPTVDFPTLAKLPQTPVPVVRADTCSIAPTENPVACPYTNAVTQRVTGLF